MEKLYTKIFVYYNVMLALVFIINKTVLVLQFETNVTFYFFKSVVNYDKILVILCLMLSLVDY